MSNSNTFKIIATTQGFKKAQGEVKGLTGSMKKFATGLVSAAAAYKAFAVGLESVQLAGRLEAVEKGFNNLSKGAGFSINTFSKLDKALDGTVDKLTLMEQANNAMLLGIADSDDQMAQLFDMAQRLAEAVGQDATFGINSLVTGLGRQSKLMLDNLGIMVDVEGANKSYAETLGKTTTQLTDQERKQAFINETIKQGRELVGGLGEESDTAARKMQRFSTSVTNLKLAIGDALIESGALDQLDRFTRFIDRFTKSDAEDRIDGINRAIDVLQEKNWAGMQKGVSDVFFELSDLSAETQAFLQAQLFGVTENGKAIGILNEAYFKILESQHQYNDSVGQTTETMKEYVSVFTETPIVAVMSEFSMLLTDQEMNAMSLQDRIRKLIETFENLTNAKEEDIRTTKEQIRTGLSAAASHKTMAQAAVDAGKSEIRIMIQTAIANILKDNSKFFGFLGPLAPVAIAGVAASASTMFEQQISRINIGSQTGFEGVVDEPTQFTVGEGGAAEYVSVTPLEGVNNAGGQGMTINISGNVMSQDYIENELSEGIAEAIRKGISFA